MCVISSTVHFDLVAISCRVIYGMGLRLYARFALVGVRVGFLLDHLKLY